MKFSFAFAAALIVLDGFVVHAGDSAVGGYPDFDAFRLKMESIAESEFASLESLGQTLGKRDVYLLRIGTGEVDEKPAVLVIGGIGATQLAGSVVATDLADRLATEAASNPEVKGMLEHVTFYFVPRVSPDACEAFFRRPFEGRDRNERPVDEDGDGKWDEDGPDDLDGDGWITQMRIADPSGEYVPDPADPRLLVKADPAKRHPLRYRLLSEGKDDDGDTEVNEDPPGGTAFNRNFTFAYPFFGEGAGPHQVSEPETRAVADFAFGRENIFLVWAFTENENLLKLWKPDSNLEKQRIKTTLQEADALDYRALADAFEACRPERNPPEGSDGKGSFEKWAYFHFGRHSIATRPWWPVPQTENDREAVKTDEEGGKPNAENRPADDAAANKAGSEEKAKDADEGSKEEAASADKQAGKPTSERISLTWFEQHGIDGFAAWKEFEHPDFPGRKVEIGGFRPLLRENPPVGGLDRVTDAAYAFLCKLPGLFPRLAIENVKSRDLGNGLYRVTVRVKNEGTLATSTRMGEISGRPIGMQAAILVDSDEAEFLDGPARREIGRLAGGAEKEITWLFRVSKNPPEGIKVRAWAPSVGNIETTIGITK